MITVFGYFLVGYYNSHDDLVGILTRETAVSHNSTLLNTSSDQTDQFMTEIEELKKSSQDEKNVMQSLQRPGNPSAPNIQQQTTITGNRPPI